MSSVEIWENVYVYVVQCGYISANEIVEMNLEQSTGFPGFNK